MKHKLIKFISVVVIAVFAWQDLVILHSFCYQEKPCFLLRSSSYGGQAWGHTKGEGVSTGVETSPTPLSPSQDKQSIVNSQWSIGNKMLSTMDYRLLTNLRPVAVGEKGFLLHRVGLISKIEFIELKPEAQRQIEILLDDSEIESMVRTSFLTDDEKIYFAQGNWEVSVVLLDKLTSKELSKALKRPIGKGFFVKVDANWHKRTQDENFRYLSHEIGHIALDRSGRINLSKLEDVFGIAKKIKEYAASYFLQKMLDYEVVRNQINNGWTRSARAYLDHMFTLGIHSYTRATRDKVGAAFQYAGAYVSAGLFFEEIEPQNIFKNRDRLAALYDLDRYDQFRLHSIIDATIDPMLKDGSWLEPRVFESRFRDFNRGLIEIFGNEPLIRPPRVLLHSILRPRAAGEREDFCGGVSHWGTSPEAAEITYCLLRPVAMKERRQRPIPRHLFYEVKRLPTVGQRVERLRKYRGLSLTKLGRESKIPHLKDIEANKRTQVARGTIRKLAETLGVDEELLCVGVAGDEVVLKQPEKIPGEFLNRVKKSPTLGKRLEELIGYRGETINGLSRKAKVAKTSMLKIARNKLRHPKVETIVRIATALGADVDVFLKEFYSPKEREEAIRLLGKEKGDEEKPEASLEMAAHIRDLLDAAKQPMDTEDILKTLQVTYDPKITLGDVVSVIDGEAELSEDRNLSGELTVKSARKILQYISGCLHLGDGLLRGNKFEVARAQFEQALSSLRQNQDLLPKEDIPRLIALAEDGIKNCEEKMDRALIIMSIAEADPIKRFEITLLRLLEERIRVVNNRLIRGSNGRFVGVDYRQVRRELMQYCNNLIKVAEENSEPSERLLLRTHLREIWREVHRRIKIFTRELIETTRELVRVEHLEGELSTEKATLTSI